MRGGLYTQFSIPVGERWSGYYGIIYTVTKMTLAMYPLSFAQYFIGQSYLNALTRPDDYLAIFNVTFEPGCRNNWHIHRTSKGGGQVLICVDGEGWYQEEGKSAQRLLPGDVVEVPTNVKHWHGAAADSWFSHLAFEYPGEDASNEWLEPVDDGAYNALS